MANLNNRIIEKRPGRPKGKKFYPVSITLSEEEIDYLERQPNVSELIRKILDDLIASERIGEDKLGAISLNLQAKNLQERLDKLKDERQHYFEEKSYCWKKPFGSDGHQLRFPLLPEPKDDEESKIAFKVLQNYDSAINSLQQKIAEIKQDILRTE